MQRERNRRREEENEGERYRNSRREEENERVRERELFRGCTKQGGAERKRRCTVEMSIKRVGQ